MIKSLTGNQEMHYIVDSLSLNTFSVEYYQRIFRLHCIIFVHVLHLHLKCKKTIKMSHTDLPRYLLAAGFKKYIL